MNKSGRSGCWALTIEQPTRSLDVAKRNRGITVGSRTGHSAACIFGLKDGQGLPAQNLVALHPKVYRHYSDT